MTSQSVNEIEKTPTKVCGAHLKRGYRMAFTMQSPAVEGDPPRVVILYVGKREPRHHANADIWDVLHDLFEVDNPPENHRKPPCCASGLPDLAGEELAAFLRRLRKFTRRR